MTQPVQEPTQGRQDSAQSFRARQLFRRPATGVRMAYAMYDWSGKSVSDGTGPFGDPVPLKAFWTTDSTVFGTTDDASPASGDPPTNTTDDHYMYFMQNGVYVFRAWMAPNGGAATWRDDTAPFFNFPNSTPNSWTGNNDQYAAMAPGTRQLGVDGEYDSSWQTYDETGIGGGFPTYFGSGGGAGSPIFPLALLYYSSQAALDLDYGGFVGYAGMINESGSSYTLTGQCEVFALISESFVAPTRIFS